MGTLGVAAFPALAAGTRDSDPVIRREARALAAHLIRQRAPAGRPETSTATRGARAIGPRPLVC